MTIGIAMIFAEAALLVADGRARRYGVPGQPIATDDSNKIIQLGPNVGLIAAGMEDITNRALETVRYNYQPRHSISEICSLVDFSLEHTWKRAILSPEVDWNDRNLNGTFLVGGVLEGTSFITSIGHIHSGRPFPINVVTLPPNQDLPPQFVIACAEQQHAGDVFEQRVTEVLMQMGPMVSFADKMKLVISAAAATIRYMQDRDPYIAGTIRYALIKSGGEFLTGIHDG